MLPPILSCQLGGYCIDIGSVVLWLWLPICLYELLFWRLLWLGLVFRIRGSFVCWCLWVGCIMVLVVGSCELWVGYLGIAIRLVLRLL